MRKFFPILLLLIFTSSYISYGAVSGEPMDDGYYVTIGVYAKSKEGYAKRYMEKAKSMGFDADYGFSNKRNYYYVYIFYSKSFKAAIAEMRKARQETEFKEAWVYVHLKGITPVPLSEEEQEEAEEAHAEVVEQEAEELTEANDTHQYEQQDATVTEDDVSEEAVEATEEAVKPTEVKEEEHLTKVHFNVVNARNREPIAGEVQIIDSERAKLLDAVEGGDTVAVSDPNNGTGDLTLIVDNFGFRKNQLSFNYYEPDTSQAYITKVDDHYEIDIDMIRYHKGDIATMYNVYFFQDASIMRPESKYELNSLLNMMKENPNYEIRIHGHTNGNRAGKIISLGDSDNFFALNEENKDGYGSAKKLSKERAEIVKQFLIANGIDEKRMDIKGWGGKRMIHEKFSNRAKHNVRVEIEILEE